MLLTFLFIFSRSIVVGLDYGHENIKISIAHLGKGVNVAFNQQNKRLTKSYFALWNTTNPNQDVRTNHLSMFEIRTHSWAFNEDAYRHYLKYPQNVFKSLTNISSDYNGLMRREAYAIILHHLFKTMDSGIHEPISTQVVFAVDPDMPRKDRYMLHEIVKMSGANLKEIVDSPSAAAHLYAIEKSSLYKNSPKTVVFVDVGAEKTWMSLFTFKTTPGNPVVRQLSLISNISIGGNLIDQRLSTYLLQKFAEKNNYDISDFSERVKLRFLDESREIKERLSLHTSVDVKIEDILIEKHHSIEENSQIRTEDLESRDMSGNIEKIEQTFECTIERNELDNLIADFNDTLSQAYIKLVDDANLLRDDIDSVELIGGSTRVPYIQDILLEVSGIGKLNRTMNSDEAIALGAGYIGASKSAEFVTTKKVKIDPFCNTNIHLVHNGKRVDLFNKTNRLDDSNFYEYKSCDNSEISIMADNPPTEVIKFKVNLPKTAQGNVTIHVDFGFDEFTLPGIFNINLNKRSTRDIEFISPKWSMTKSNYNRSVAFIKRMDDVTEERRQTQVAYSDFERYLYQAKDRLAKETAIHQVTTKAERINLSVAIQKDLKWLINGTHKMPLTARIIKSRMQLLQKKMEDVELKASELPKREPAFQALLSKIQEVCKALNETWPIERPWMPEKAINDMKTAVDHAQNYYHIYREQQGNRTDTEMPGVLAADIERQTYYLEMSYNFTLRTTKNPPTPKPPKTPNPYVKTYSTVEEFERDAEKQRERDLFGL
ncbi:dnaK protein [Tritrichomonas foetus]|uniref:DnaK protein n=1 Tax=Tritrichomonas foetus TaxID=1144522 RepID=A0A1J4K2S7_9EUKA|nr:dnaK protein [Tritrichomonas foetus]|eukprot:OHT04038.1 dnaK protein [Tritrichomonas foetus]